MSAVVEVNGLTVEFETMAGSVRAVDDLSFSVRAGETVALVGESGSGKTTAALSLLRLIPSPPSRIVAGSVMFEGHDLVTASEAQIRSIRGQRIGVIFQDPMMALNPVYTIERQVGEVLRLGRGMSRREALAEVIELLRLVGVPAPSDRARQYPHNLSGGMRQRVMIAMALACRPQLLIADEPTTALDVTIQAQVLRLLDDLKSKLGMAVLLITHDLAVVAETARRVVVMYAGQKVEEAPTRQIFREPRHPYTRGLLRATRRETREDGSLWEIAGTIAADAGTLAGCRFAARCPMAAELCRRESPELVATSGDGVARCFAAEGRLA